MDYLQFKLSIGEMNDIQVTEELTIYHRLFVDDVGIFIPTNKQRFTKLQEALRLYELASGAKLNLAKPIIIPLALLVIHQWLHDTSCIISNPGEVQKYLGAPFGQQLKQIDMYNFFLDRVIKRISGWAN